jgi:hypothetical protein
LIFPSERATDIFSCAFSAASAPAWSSPPLSSHPPGERAAAAGARWSARTDEGGRTYDLAAVAVVCSALPGTSVEGMTRLPPRPPTHPSQDHKARGPIPELETPAGGRLERRSCKGGSAFVRPELSVAGGTVRAMADHACPSPSRLAPTPPAAPNPATPHPGDAPGARWITYSTHTDD